MINSSLSRKFEILLVFLVCCSISGSIAVGDYFGREADESFEIKRMAFDRGIIPANDYDKLIFSTYLGGGDRDEARYMVLDAENNIYVTGVFESTGFATDSAFQSTLNGSLDTFVAKFSPTGDRLFFTYLGGSEDEIADGITLDSQNNIIIFGVTKSPNFPTVNPIQANLSGSSDLFITKFSNNGSEVLYSSYFGGSGVELNYDGYHGMGIALDSQDNILFSASTRSSNYPVRDSIQDYAGAVDAVVTKLSPTGDEILFSTYLGGNDDDAAGNVCANSQDDIICVGNTKSLNLETVNAVMPSKENSDMDAFVYKFSNTTHTLETCTYFGGSSAEERVRCSIDLNDSIILSGNTYSPYLPGSEGAFQANKSGRYDGFITKLSAEGDGVIFTTYLGGSSNDYLFGTTVDAENNIYGVGATSSDDIPAETGYQTNNKGGEDGFLFKIAANGTRMEYFSYFGGSNTDWVVDLHIMGGNRVVISGVTYSNYNFPLKNAHQSTYSRSGTANAGTPEDGFIACLTIPEYIDTTPSDDADSDENEKDKSIPGFFGLFGILSLTVGFFVILSKHKRSKF